MSNPNPERDERIAQIRERQSYRAEWAYGDDIEFLLSLLDSHGAECNAADWAIERVQSEYLRGKSEAATRMRDRCVTKVREVPLPWHHPFCETQTETGCNCFLRNLRTVIVTSLESLTLEQVEQEK